MDNCNTEAKRERHSSKFVYLRKHYSIAHTLRGMLSFTKVKKELP